MLQLNSKNFEKEVLQSKKPVIVDFWAEWCSPCRVLAPIFEELSKEITNLKFAKLDTEANNGLAQRYDIMSIPCLIIFKDGKEFDRIIGLSSKENLKRKIDIILSR